MSETARCRTQVFDPRVSGYPRRIGGIEVENPVWLAPLAGITFASVRRFYRMLGAGLVHTEMVSALGLFHRGRKTKELLHGTDDERPVVLQLFGSEADDIARGAEAALQIRKFDGLQINMACPMPKVTKRGSGSKLLERPEESSKIIKSLKQTGLPVSAKIRIMPHGSSVTTCGMCDLLLSSGADLIFIHGRTAAQRYEGKALREPVEEAARMFPGMIGGSGDCYAPDDFMDYIDRGCAAVLAARGILRDVFLISAVLKALGAEVPDSYRYPSLDFQTELLLELGRSVYNTEGQSQALMISRRMLAALFKGYPGASVLRRHGALARTWSEMEEILFCRQRIMEKAVPDLTKENFPRGVIDQY